MQEIDLSAGFTDPPKRRRQRVVRDSQPSDSGRLDPDFERQVNEILTAVSGRGLKARLAEGYRTPEKQDEYYSQGRTRPGRIITNARGTQGRHTRGLAADIDLIDDAGLPLRDDDPAWGVLGEEAKRRGLTWGGSWTSLRDRRHVESRRGGSFSRDQQKPPTQQTRPRRVSVPDIDLSAGLEPEPAKPQAARAAPAVDRSKPSPRASQQSKRAAQIQRGRALIDSLLTPDPTVPRVQDFLKPQPQRATTFAEDRAKREAKIKAESEAFKRLRDRARAAANFEGEEYQNFLRLNRSPDSPNQREGFLTLKAKQAISTAGGSPFTALQGQDRERARQQRVSQISTGQKVAQVPKSVAVGLSQGVGSTLKGLATTSRAIVDQITDTSGFDTRDAYVYQLGDYIQKRVPDLVRSNPDLEQEFLVGKAPAVIGQVAEFALGSWATKSPRLAVAVLGATTTAGDAYDEVRALGGSDDEAVLAALLAGGILGPTELIGMRGAMRAISGTPREATIRAALKTALREGRRDAIENALQEAGQEYGQGLITGNRRSPGQLAEASLLGVIGASPTVPLNVASRFPRRGRATPPSAGEPITEESPDAAPAPQEAPATGTLADQQREAAAAQVAAVRPEVKRAIESYLSDLGVDIEAVTSDADTRQHRDITSETAEELQAFMRDLGMEISLDEAVNSLYALRHEALPQELELNLDAGLVDAGLPETGLRNMAQRITNGEERFISSAMRSAGLTRDQAITALGKLKEAEAIKIDPVGGSFTYTHGAFGDASALRRAAGIESESAPTTPTPLTGARQPDRRSKRATLVTGERADISLSQFVRKNGGIAPGDMYRGELDRLRQKQTGTTGLINKKAKQGDVRQTADIIMQMANDAGFRDPSTGQPFERPGDFLAAVERDVAGEKVFSTHRDPTPSEEDLAREEAAFYAQQQAYYLEQEAAERAEAARVELLESGRGALLFDRLREGTATDAEQREFTTLARQLGLNETEIDDLISGDPEPFEGLEASSSPWSAETQTTRAIEQPTGPAATAGGIGPAQPSAPAYPVQRAISDFEADEDSSGSLRDARHVADVYDQDGDLDYHVVEGNSDDGPILAMVYPDTDARAKLEAEFALNVSGTQEFLDDLTRRNHDVRLVTSSPPDQLRTTKDRPPSFGPGAASAREPFPEVRERRFGKRFVEDERIAKEIRDIGTARYYEPIPNKVTAEQAKALVDQRGVAESIHIIKDESNSLQPHIRSAMGQIVIQRLNRAYRNLKDSSPKEAESVLESSVDLAEWAMDYGTRLGQGVQSFAMWSRLTPEGVLLQYKRGIRKAAEKKSKHFREEVAEIISTANRKGMTDAERAAALAELVKTNKTARKVRSELSRIAKLAKEGKLTDQEFYEAVGGKLGLPQYTPEIAQRITELSLQIEAAPEGLPRDKAVTELAKFIAEQKGFDPGDLPLGIYYAHILSGYNTHAVNFADTGLNVLSEINGLALTEPRAAARIYAGYLRGLSEGKWDAWLQLTQGRMVVDGKWLEVPRLMEVARFGKKGGVPIKTDTAAGRLAKRLAESRAAIPLRAYKYVTRAMAASDALMFRGAKEARATLLAYRIAKDEGLKDSALETRVREILALDHESDFRAQAAREGFTGSEASFRALELREMMRSAEISTDAAEWAGEATYNHKPHGTLGMFAETIGGLSEKVKPLKLFVPFTRIVANVTNRGLNWTPYGYKRAFYGWGFGNYAEPLTGDARAAMLTRATAGTAGMVLLGVLQSAGLLEIHGNGPSDREKRRQLQEGGWRPYSLKVGKTYISYLYSPIGLGLSIIGNATDSQRYHELEQKDAATRAAYATMRIGSTIFSQSFLSGLSRLFGALSEEPARSVSSVKQFLGGTVAAMTTPNLARDIYRLFDNKTYQSNTLTEDLIRNTPFAALRLRPVLNAFGEPVRIQRQRFFDIETTDPAWQFVVEKGLRVPVPSRSIEMEKGRRIDPDEYYDLLKTTGPKIRAWVLKNRTRLSRMKEQDAQDELSEAAARIRKFEMVRMRMIARRRKAAA